MPRGSESSNHRLKTPQSKAGHQPHRRSGLRHVTDAFSLPKIPEEGQSDGDDQDKPLNEEAARKIFLRNTWQPFFQEAEKTGKALNDVIVYLEELGKLKTDLSKELKKLENVPGTVPKSQSNLGVIERLRQVLETRRENATVTLADLKSIVECTQSAKEIADAQVLDALKGLRN